VDIFIGICFLLAGLRKNYSNSFLKIQWKVAHVPQKHLKDFVSNLDDMLGLKLG